MFFLFFLCFVLQNTGAVRSLNSHLVTTQKEQYFHADVKLYSLRLKMPGYKRTVARRYTGILQTVHMYSTEVYREIVFTLFFIAAKSLIDPIPSSWSNSFPESSFK